VNMFHNLINGTWNFENPDLADMDYRTDYQTNQFSSESNNGKDGTA
jgi:hypothetical protein